MTGRPTTAQRGRLGVPPFVRPWPPLRVRDPIAK